MVDHITYILIHFCKNGLLAKNEKNMQSREMIQVGKNQMLLVKVGHQDHRILVPVGSLCFSGLFTSLVL